MTALDRPTDDAPPAGEAPFWRRKTLAEMTPQEWESLCDGCGRCCLIKLEDEERGTLAVTRLACRLLDIGACRCGDYANRHVRVSDCVAFDAGTVGKLTWLPDTCAYRLIDGGRDLPWWHHLVSGSRETVHWAGASVRYLAVSERGIPPRRFARYIVDEAG